jgi:hypothetical protein
MGIERFHPSWFPMNTIQCSTVQDENPISLVETGLWTGLTYYVIGYAPSAIRYSSPGTCMLNDF